MFEKLKGFAKKGNGRRFLNTLNKKETILTPIELDELLSVYRDIGLPIEVEALKKRRGILRDDQYDTLAQAVKVNCSAENYHDFSVCLRHLLKSGMTMNPTRMEI